MATKKNARMIALNFDADVLEQVERYRFTARFSTRTKAIMFLLRHALAQKPKPEESAK